MRLNDLKRIVESDYSDPRGRGPVYVPGGPAGVYPVLIPDLDHEQHIEDEYPEVYPGPLVDPIPDLPFDWQEIIDRIKREVEQEWQGPMA
jgi:hypothetical protein